MTSTRNKLPVAVDAVSGGNASPRIDSTISSLDTSSGSIVLGSARRFRVFPSVRSWTNRLFLLGYTSPLSVANAEYVVASSTEIRDTVPPGTTLYWMLVDATTFLPTLGGANDYLVAARYE